MTGDPYSRLVSFLKIALPLVALAILSTVFLVSSRIEPGESIPFAEGEVAERIRSQQVTGSVFSGVTTGGDRISFSAREIVTAADRTNVAHHPVAQLDFASGGSVRLEAERGDVDLNRDIVTMTRDVVIESKTGYTLRSDSLTSHLSYLDIVAPGEVTGNGPAGTLRAGGMRISEQKDGGNVQLLFTDGVKLVYDPKEAK